MYDTHDDLVATEFKRRMDDGRKVYVEYSVKISA